MKRLKKIAVLAAVVATALLVATVAFGATPGDDGSAKLCSVKYGPHKGEVRLMDSSTTACHSSEQSVTLATAASIPTPQPAPKTTTEFAVLKDLGNGSLEVTESSGAVTTRYIDPNEPGYIDGDDELVSFGHSVAACAIGAVNGRGGFQPLHVRSDGDISFARTGADAASDQRYRITVVCNA